MYQYHSNLREGVQTYEGTYLVQQQLIRGCHHGYSVDESVYARVIVKNADFYDEPKEREFQLRESKLTLAFDAFVSADLRVLYQP